MRTGRPRSFDRDKALEGAIAVFWEHGYDATSISLLTQALGIGAPSLYAAFGDKRALFLEALDRYLRTYGAFTERALAEEPNARDAVERLLREAAAAYTRPGRPRGRESSPRTPTLMPSRRSTGPFCRACRPKPATAPRGPTSSRSPRQPSGP